VGRVPIFQTGRKKTLRIRAICSFLGVQEAQTSLFDPLYTVLSSFYPLQAIFRRFGDFLRIWVDLKKNLFGDFHERVGAYHFFGQEVILDLRPHFLAFLKFGNVRLKTESAGFTTSLIRLDTGPLPSKLISLLNSDTPLDFFKSMVYFFYFFFHFIV
jgi:hypothetical protein